jgi:hypothetical protein
MNEVTPSESRSSVQVGLHHPKPCVDPQGNPCLTGIWAAVARALQTNALNVSPESPGSTVLSANAYHAKPRTCYDALGNEYPC